MSEEKSTYGIDTLFHKCQELVNAEAELLLGNVLSDKIEWATEKHAPTNIAFCPYCGVKLPTNVSHEIALVTE